MAIKLVNAEFNGQSVSLSYNPSTDMWEATLIPDSTSFHQSGGYYNILLRAENDHNVEEVTSGTVLDGLRLFVNERDPPTITLISPSEGYITTNQPTFVFGAIDESGGSGVDISTLLLLLDGSPVTEIETSHVSNGYRIAYTPAEPLSEGPHILVFSIRDNDGNLATLSANYTVDTMPSVLAIREPNYRNVVDTPDILLQGTVVDDTTPGITVTVELNDRAYTQVSYLGKRGDFSWVLPLEVGLNFITITVTDGVGWETAQDLYIIRLITDRTQADVNRLAALMAKPESTWTTAERWDFLTASYKGNYDYTDFNRVSMAVDFLALKFQGYGYSVNYAPVDLGDGRIAWEMTDFPTPEFTAAYLANIARLRELAPIDIPMPEDMEEFTYQEANDIEAILVALDSYSPYINNTFYAGEVYTGEV